MHKFIARELQLNSNFSVLCVIHYRYVVYDYYNCIARGRNDRGEDIWPAPQTHSGTLATLASAPFTENQSLSL